MESVKNQLWTDKPRNFFGIAINFTRYIITSEKFITRKGFFNIHEDEIMLYRITDKNYPCPLPSGFSGAAPSRCTPRIAIPPPRRLNPFGIPAP